MKDGILTFSFNDGRITSVSNAPALDATYDELFSAAKESLQSEPEDIKAGASVVIFGAFLMEALINCLLREVLYREVAPRGAASLVWAAMKRRPPLERLKLIEELVPAIQNYSRPINKSIQSVFELRNQVCHFSDDPTEIHGPLELDDVPGFLEGAPEPSLVSRLRLSQLEGFIQSVEELKSWIVEARDQHNRKHGIKSEEVSPPDGYGDEE